MRPRASYSRFSVVFLLVAVVSASLACSEVKDGSEQAERGITWFAKMRAGDMPQDITGDWQSWLSREWQQGNGTNPSFLVVRRVCPGGECHISEEAVVNSCDELFDADQRGLWLPGRDQRDSYQEWQLKCYAGRILSQAKSPEASFVDDFQLDRSGFHKLPLGVAWPMGWQDKETLATTQAHGGVLADYLGAAVPNAQVSSIGSGYEMQAVLTYGEGWIQVWNLLAQGDFNHDQLADLLISVKLSDGAGATYGYRLFVVTRVRQGAPLELVKEVALGPAVRENEPY